MRVGQAKTKSSSLCIILPICAFIRTQLLCSQHAVVAHSCNLSTGEAHKGALQVKSTLNCTARPRKHVSLIHVMRWTTFDPVWLAEEPSEALVGGGVISRCEYLKSRRGAFRTHTYLITRSPNCWPTA